MNTYNIKGTEDSPAITLDRINGIYSFVGCSLPENVIKFYQPVFNWLEIFSIDPPPKITIDFNLEYFNTATSRILLDIMIRFKNICTEKTCDLKINWYYNNDDEETREAGEDFSDIIQLPFNYIPL
jgi:SiaC family regulatory phosphoprotein